MATNNPDINCYYYYVPSIKGEGWGRVILTSNGLFAAYTDYSNCCYQWTHFGDIDFRQFIVDLIDKKEKDYIIKKMFSGCKVYDPETTLKILKDEIARLFANESINQKEMENELNLISEEMEYDEFSLSIRDFEDWAEQTIVFSDPSEMICYKYPASIVCFRDKFLPRLAEEIRKNIEEENET